jgi:hypothetical protein
MACPRTAKDKMAISNNAHKATAGGINHVALEVGISMLRLSSKVNF